MEKIITKELVEKIKKISEEMFDDCVAFAQKLVQTPSISSTEKALADLDIAEMEKLGYDEVIRDDFGNVIGIVNGTEDGPTIMYNSHMDHVSPGDKANWEGYEPYGGLIDKCLVDNQEKTEKDLTECIHGRGASDVKCGEAVQIYAGGILVKLREMGIKFKGKFMFTGVVLEEPAENIGTIKMIDESFPKLGLDYDAFVSSEATSLKIYHGHRGRTEILVKVHGRTSHGSAPWLGINAVYKAMPLIDRIKGELYDRLPVHPELKKSTIALTIIECKPGALSIIPDECLLSLDRRTIPGESDEYIVNQIQEIIDEMSAADPEFKAEVSVKYGDELTYTGKTIHCAKSCPPWFVPRDHEFVKSAAYALEAMGQEVKYGVWDFGTDMSKACGIDKKPCIGYSPMQEQFAHTPYDKCRLDFMKTALGGNVAIFLNAVAQGKEAFEKIKD